MWKYILEMPFQSRKKFLRKGKYEYSGTVYYLLDKNGYVLRDILVFDENKILEYRPNDNAMMIGKNNFGTYFWQMTKNERSVLLENSPINNEVKIANKDTIKKLNKLSINSKTTALSMEGFITGSNTTGAESQIERTPFYISTTKFFGLRFVNPIKHMRKTKNNRGSLEKFKITFEVLEKSQKIDLSQYLNMFKNAKRHFYKFNPEAYNLLFSRNEWEKIKLYFEDLKQKDIRKEQKANDNNIERVIREYFNGTFDKKSLIQRLRGIQRLGLLLEYNLNNKISPIVDRNESASNMDAAHIIDVKFLINNDEKLAKIADVNNGILLPKDIHWKFDKKNGFTITSDFEIRNKGKLIGKIDSVYWNNDRKINLKIRNSKI